MVWWITWAFQLENNVYLSRHYDVKNWNDVLVARNLLDFVEAFNFRLHVICLNLCNFITFKLTHKLNPLLHCILNVWVEIVFHNYWSHMSDKWITFSRGFCSDPLIYRQNNPKGSSGNGDRPLLCWFTMFGTASQEHHHKSWLLSCKLSLLVF